MYNHRCLGYRSPALADCLCPASRRGAATPLSPHSSSSGRSSRASIRPATACGGRVDGTAAPS